MCKNTEIQTLSTIVPRGTPKKNSFITKLCTVLPKLDEKVAARLFTHYEILIKWNKTHNLTRIVSDEDAFNKHYLDALLPLMDLTQVKSIADLGSGTGLPGFAAAALWPETEVILVETVGKKCSFMRAVAAKEPDMNVRVIKGRVEKIKGLRVDLLMTRATFPWQKVPAYCSRHIKEEGELLAYIGKEKPEERVWAEICEREDLRDGKIVSYSLPGTEYSRHLALAVKNKI